MIHSNQINSVSKNNFLSLMRTYEKNYKIISKLINFKIINKDNINAKFESKSKITKKKLLLSISYVTNHTALIKFSYNFFSKDTYINYVELKIYFDSKQLEIINSNGMHQRLFCNDIQKFHNLRLSKWYKSYFLSIWLDNCLENGYSFDAQSEV